MRWLIRVFNFYLDASIHVAMSVFSLVVSTGLIMNFEVGYHLYYALFFATISCYNFVKYGAEAEKYVLVANKYHKNIQFLSFITLAIAFYHSMFLSLNSWLCIGLIVVLTGLYAVPIFPKKNNLRSLGLLKVVLVSLVWAVATVILPIVYTENVLSWDVYIESIQRFLLVLILLVPFEIRDLEYDAPNLKTIAQRLGSTYSKSLGAFAAMILFFLTFLKDKISIMDVVGKGSLFLVLVIVMFLTKRKQTKYFSSFWVESIPIFWLVLLWMTRKYF